ncbi:YJCS-like protein [Mya arenaria]|uniref:YJCS-like protein n=1 Tax=Mya arenaria TaxID=6604 RepID=A0ABY7EUA6_MYAAR|nr:linear primary-alkylsulfatase-like [Mya arenaria]WAR13440.1 YJCS-like protein [Mya arenaria]
MSKLGLFTGLLLLFAAVFYGRQEWSRVAREAVHRKLVRSTDTLREIQEHAKEFNRKEIIKATDSIYVGLGYALANSIMLVGPSGLVIVDVTETLTGAREIFDEFRKISDKPVTDIIYTHNHADHVNGATAFVEDDLHPPNVWAHESIKKGFEVLFTGASDAHFARAMRQFGVFLPEKVSAGIGHRLKYGVENTDIGPIFPTKFVPGNELDVKLGGLDLKIVHIPGETDDQIGVWVPSERAFLCADDLYRAFPNLYAIRGTKTRSLLTWVRSLDKIIDLEPDILIPSHTRPVTGHDTVMKVLTEYRDAIQFIHDQSLRLTNYGYHPDEIANMVKLPVKLASSPFLKEFYGSVKWSAKSVFTEHEGWFSGDPVDLDPLTRDEKAQKMVELVGAETLIEKAKTALQNNDFQWALELSSYVARLDAGNNVAKDIQVESLTELGSRQLSNNGRNYYLTCAMEIATGLKLTSPQGSKAEFINAFPIDYVIDTLPRLFKPEECEDRNETIVFEFSDPPSIHSIQLRNGVAISRHKEPKHCDIRVKVNEAVLKEVVAKTRSSAAALLSGDISVEGGVLAFKSFMDCFDRDSHFTLR